ncbi:hypothetical protein M1N58_01180 [Dehalococcoidales bacterium]|nr:hypothetical protein [Dehalococcoidales bacterium]
MTELAITQKEIKLKNGVIVPKDIKLSPQDLAKLEELSKSLSAEETEELLKAQRLSQQKREEDLKRMFRETPRSSDIFCVEYNEKNKLYSTQKRSSYYQERRAERDSKKKRAEKLLKNLPHLPGWWREILKKKKDYAIPERGEKEKIIARAKEFFNWEKGEWTLGTWWSRVPMEALWEFAFAAAEKYACGRNPVYFIKCLATAAELFSRYPDPRVWREVSQRLGPYLKLSRERLLMLLEAVTRALKQFLETGGILSDLIRKLLPVPKRRDVEMFKLGWDTS